jgi:ribosome-binding factor A
MSTRRVQQVASLIRTELARTIREDVSDPSLRGISLHDVQLSNDLRYAKVFYACEISLDNDPAPPTAIRVKEIEKGFHRALPFFKKKLADKLQLRYVPSLEFHWDVHAESVNRLYDLFEEVHQDTH